ncbi:hypothetical protein ONA92_21565 [Mycobacteroides salmoniphilum]|uniref:DUF4031 domain-containing protein n=1 Tax=Mycobacteroides salmoniphilum TaxID=404941 RepID=UPI003561CC58
MTTVWFVSDLHIGHGLVAVIRAERAGIALPANPVDRQLAAVEWHDRTHYDVTDTKRQDAIKLDATQIGYMSRESMDLLRRRRQRRDMGGEL